MKKYSASICIALFAAFAANANNNSSAKDQAHAAVAVHGMRAPSQRIFLDSGTGQPRKPTAEESQQLQQEHEQQQQNDASNSAKSSEAPRKVQFPDGAVGIYMKKPKSMLQARITADGRILMDCDDVPSVKVTP